MNHWTDPDRWEDADMQRDAWIKHAALLLLIATVITLVVIGLGVMFS